MKIITSMWNGLKRSSSRVGTVTLLVVIICHFATVCHGASSDVWTTATTRQLEKGGSRRLRANQRVTQDVSATATTQLAVVASASDTNTVRMLKKKKGKKKTKGKMKKNKKAKKKTVPIPQPTPAPTSAPTSAECAGGPFKVTSLNANEIFCGQTLLGCKYVLTEAIDCMESDGPTLSNGTTIDCCQNSISGEGLSGITVPVDVSETRVTNCAINFFFFGYSVYGSNNVIESSTFKGSTYGVEIEENAQNNQVLCCEFLSCAEHCVRDSAGGSGTSITGSLISNSIATGVLLADGSITCSRVVNNTGSGIGIPLGDAVTIDRTYVDRNGVKGIAVTGSGNLTLLNELAFCYNSDGDVYDNIPTGTVIEPTPLKVACNSNTLEPGSRVTCGAPCPVIPNNFDILSLPGCADFCPYGIGTFNSSTCLG